jgi:omega-6 fatty acid desaturase (delta-12 desaturase)
MASVPCPASLAHLRPTDRHGFLVVLVALTTTAGAVWLSIAGGWTSWVTGQLLLAAALVHWFIVLHECGHRTLFRGRRLNAAVGQLAGFMSLVPYTCWTRVHGRHHRWTGWQDLDPTTEALAPRARGWLERTAVNFCWRCWIPLFSTLYRIQNFWNLRRLAALFPRIEDRRQMQREAAIHAAAYLVLLFALGPLLVLRLFGLALLVSLIVEDLLLLSQHTHIPQHVSDGRNVEPFPALEQEVFTRSIRLPGWMSALLLHFDAHELHHMYPFVPGYHLKRIPYSPSNEIGWWKWVALSKRLRGETLLFQNRSDTGFRI